ncbi:MAG: hypothetical protein GX431_05730 [Bacteroidales bacterium]|jgi:hypothetical protein|nr:hypothetical protein [Bacteroidales bacterium]
MTDRTGFIKSIVRAGLWLLLAFIVFAVGNRVVSGSGCSGCPVKSSCSGKSECDRKK